MSNGQLKIFQISSDTHKTLVTRQDITAQDNTVKVCTRKGSSWDCIRPGMVRQKCQNCVMEVEHFLKVSSKSKIYSWKKFSFLVDYI